MDACKRWKKRAAFHERVRWLEDKSPGTVGKHPLAAPAARAEAGRMKLFPRIALSGLFLMLVPAAHSAEEWVRHFNGAANGNDQAVAIATDPSGDVFVTGYSFGGGSGSDFATIKYSPAGLPLWTNRYDGPAHSQDGPVALGVDPGGDVVVAGSSTGGVSGYRSAV